MNKLNVIRQEWRLLQSCELLYSGRVGAWVLQGYGTCRGVGFAAVWGLQTYGYCRAASYCKVVGWVWVLQGYGTCRGIVWVWVLQGNGYCRAESYCIVVGLDRLVGLWDLQGYSIADVWGLQTYGYCRATIYSIVVGWERGSCRAMGLVGVWVLYGQFYCGVMAIEGD